MNARHWLVIIAALTLTACSASHRPQYSGREESTEGVPGFENGKKVSPYVKLGQSYKVDGEWHVPRNQPTYVEEGMASWYGPGFHGGKTANGEEFDSAELTAAHRTLPLPSIVRVTMVSTGKSVYVRINDRGPFAHSRIIDLSRGAAEKIGLIRSGVAKVRVEYMKDESMRFAELLAQGRHPKSIDLAGEIINYKKPGVPEPTQYAAVTQSSPVAGSAQKNPKVGLWETIIPSAYAEEPAEGSMPLSTGTFDEEENVSTDNAAPTPDLVATDAADPANQPHGESPFTMADSDMHDHEEDSTVSVYSVPVDSPAEPPTKPVPAPAALYVQLGAFQNQGNAERLKLQFPEAKVYHLPNREGRYLFHVRLGPYLSESASDAALKKAHANGIEARIIR